MNSDRILVVDGDLLELEVDGIVNAWNRNVFPWWLLLPQGVSASIQRKAGLAPFRELRRHGVLPLGGAVITTAGELPLKAIIHVAGIGLTWRATEQSIRLSVRNAIALAAKHAIARIAFPLIGAGTGGFTEQESQRIMLDELGVVPFDGEVLVASRALSSHGRSRPMTVLALAAVGLACWVASFVVGDRWPPGRYIAYIRIPAMSVLFGAGIGVFFMVARVHLR